MYQIDIRILNQAVAAPGRLTRPQENLVFKLDRMRQGRSFLKLKAWERQELKKIGRIFDIYPDSQASPPHTNTHQTVTGAR